jgi:hypothetical protein
MNVTSFTARTAVAAGAVVAAAGLALAGCGGSSGSSGGSGSGGAGGSGSTAANSSSGSSGGSGGSGPSTVGGASTTSQIFPVAVGNRWVYKTDLEGSTGESINKILAVTPVSDGQKVTMAVQTTLPGETKPSTASDETLIFHPDGSITIPLTQFGSTGVTVKSGSVEWPSASNIASGQPHATNLVMSSDEAGHKSTIREHVIVRGDGTATVTVPAGTYQTSIIEETELSKIDGIAVDLTVKTWVADGVGPVKSEVISDDNGKTTVSTEQVLVSFHTG